MKIIAKKSEISESASFGDDVKIVADSVKIGNNVKIGVRSDENFRSVAGVRIVAKNVVIGDGSVIGREVLIKGGDLKIGKSVNISNGCTLAFEKSLRIGDRAGIGQDCVIEGYDIFFGNDLWIKNNVHIGGGMSKEVHSSLRVGDFCHIGEYTFINTARPVVIGNEVGIGMRSAIFTHGIYLSTVDGFPAKFAPVEIGDRCWLPNAIVNPGVKIGHDSVIAGGSVVTKDIPPCCLAGGMPAKVIKENAFPVRLDKTQTFETMREVLKMLGEITSKNYKTSVSVDADAIKLSFENDADIIYMHDISVFPAVKKRTIFIVNGTAAKDFDRSKITLFNIKKKEIAGLADDVSSAVFEHLRRFGIRFRFAPEKGSYVGW